MPGSINVRKSEFIKPVNLRWKNRKEMAFMKSTNYTLAKIEKGLTDPGWTMNYILYLFETRHSKSTSAKSSLHFMNNCD